MEDIRKKCQEAADAYDADKSDENEARLYEVSLEAFKVGDAFGHLMLGQCLLFGFGTEPDHETGLKYLKVAQEAGYIGTYYAFGYAYYHGYGVEQDRERAYALLREGEERGDTGMRSYIKYSLDFRDKQKEKWEAENTEHYITDEELPETLERAKVSTLSQYLVARYYYDKGDTKNARSFALSAQNGGFAKADYLIRTMEYDEKYKKWDEIDDIYTELKKNGVPKTESGHEPNAVLLLAGNKHRAEAIYIEDFSTTAGLGAPIGAERIDIISTRRLVELSELVFCATLDDMSKERMSLVGYCDSHGMRKALSPNGAMQYFSGYPEIRGDAVLCGYENNDYVPLLPIYAENLARWINAGGRMPRY